MFVAAGSEGLFIYEILPNKSLKLVTNINAHFIQQNELVIKDVYYDEVLNNIYILNIKLGIHLIKWDPTTQNFEYDRNFLIDAQQGKRFSYYMNPVNKIASFMVLI